MYDRPFFKRLSANDIGINTHQGGPAIPISLRPFLPPLPLPTTNATEEYFLTLDLFDGATPLGPVVCRWHYQTWAGSRNPETRVTQNIVPRLLNRAAVGDYLTFERRLGTVDRYRVRLVRAGTEEHRRIPAPIDRMHPGGPVFSDLPPRLLTGLLDFVDAVYEGLEHPLELFGRPDEVDEHTRLLRDTAFQRVIRRAYSYRCAVCNEGLVMPVDNADHEPPREPEGAHIVPVAARGPDDIRNGICLCRTHHWAFDHGLIYVSTAMFWQVSPTVLREPRNSNLNENNEIHISVPDDPRFGPSPLALQWHRENVAIR